MIRRFNIRRTPVRLSPSKLAFPFTREPAFRKHNKFQELIFARRWVHAHRKGGVK